MGTGGKEAHRPLQQRLYVDLSLRFRLPPERRGLLVDSTHRQVELFSMALKEFAKEIGALVRTSIS
jgi:hypothetical protein